MATTSLDALTEAMHRARRDVALEFRGRGDRQREGAAGDRIPCAGARAQKKVA